MPRLMPVLFILCLAVPAAFVGVAATASRSLAGDAPATPAAKSPHPHWSDGGALSWSTKLAAALEAAAKSDKLVFIEYGRET